MKAIHNAEKWAAYDNLIKEHELLKVQYDSLQELYHKVCAHKIQKVVFEPVDNSRIEFDE